ncbi:DUF975 family protein [Metabacillus fastidiosus]|uniref:DUF975 family protein n=1 Tax=Metabacillus fastidiosus TaxID=1458 RepID=UPI003D2A54F1
MISQCKRAAKQALQGRWWFMVGAGVILTILTSIPSIISPATYVEEESLTALQQLIDFTTLILSILLIPLSVGWFWLTLEITRNKNVEMTMLFEPFLKMFWKSIWVSIVIGFFTFLWTLLLIIPGIIKAISYSFTLYILKDRPELSAIQAITESRKMINGYKGKAFLLSLSFIGWLLLGIITLGLGFLFIYPYYSVTYAQFYEEVKAKQNDINVEE